MKIFLTGATGYIGNRLMRTILAKGHEVHTILRDPAKRHHLEAAGVRIFKGDLSDKDNLSRAMEGCEQAYHTAALARLWAADSNPFIETNVKGTEHVMQAAAEQGVRKVVFTSSASILAPYKGKMLDEGDHRKDGFESEYARTKHMAGEIVRGYVSAKMDTAIVIPTRVYGAGIMTHSNAISRMLDDLMKRNTSFVPACLDVVANYVYVEDVVNGHLLAMEKATGGESYILGGENISYRAFYDAVSDFTGKNNLLKMPLWVMKAAGYVNLAQYHLFKKDPAFTPDIIGRFFRNIHVSSEKAVRELGYEITPFREGLAETIRSLKSQDAVR
jgi:nucleoside-diphosphate-sugar epimerase